MSKNLVKYALASTLTLSVLTGCVASGHIIDRIEERKTAQWDLNDSLSDTIVAVGVPSKPIKNYENALVLSGQKQSYLIQTPNYDDSFVRLLNSDLDLKYMTLRPNRYAKDGAYRVEVGGKDCSSKHGCVGIDFEYDWRSDDPETNLEAKRKSVQLLADAGFRCIGGERHPYCTRSIEDAKLTIVSKPNNADSLTYKLRESAKIHFYQNNGTGKIAQAGLWMVLPIAIVFDLVTLPVQPMPEK